MTQRARAATIAAELPRAPLELDGRSYALERRGDDVWAKMPDLDALADAERSGAREGAAPVPTVERPLVLTTGSHHYQGYWVSGRRDGELRMLPFVWLVAERAWLPRRDVFLQPPRAPQHAVRWNSNCIQCHSVAGKPGHDAKSDRFETEVVELGIACEACHGPGGAHVRRHADPFARYAQREKHGADPSIVNPARLAPERANAVCGQCHAYAYPRDEDDWWARGYSQSFRPGQDLASSRVVLTRDGLGLPGAPSVDASEESLFWPDGTIRVGGREYNGLVQSACFLRGEGARKVTCLSCHAMHRGDPSGQIAPDRAGDAACTQCHERVRDEGVRHTHHAAPSPGSRCVGCHMPRTSYALLAGVRSHRIDSPRVAASVAPGRPPACNLCHLDKSLAWTADELAAWYRVPAGQALDARAASEPLAVAMLLRGNAAERALAAAAMGDDDALRASGRGWEAPYLQELERDPYAAVRFIARRSLDKHRGPPSGAPPALDRAAMRAMLAERDDREVTIAE